MKSLIPKQTHFTFFDMVTDRTIHLPIPASAECQDLIKRMLESTRIKSDMVDWRDGVSIMANLTPADMGAATLVLAASAPMLNGTIRCRQTLFRLEVATSPWIEDQAWDLISKDYIAAMLKASGTMSALGSSPDTCPWAAGFYHPSARDLPSKEKEAIYDMAHAIAAVAVQYCLVTCKPDSAGGKKEERDDKFWLNGET